MKLLTAISFITLTGCSWVSQTSAPGYSPHAIEERQTHKRTCTRSFGAPIADTILGSLLLLPAIGATGASISALNTRNDSTATIGWISMAAGFYMLSTIYYISSLNGYSTAKQCRQYLNNDPSW